MFGSIHPMETTVLLIQPHEQCWIFHTSMELHFPRCKSITLKSYVDMVALFYVASRILGEAMGRVLRNSVSSKGVQARIVKAGCTTGKHLGVGLTSFSRVGKTTSPWPCWQAGIALLFH